MIVIKLPRDKVEIFELVEDSEDEIDVETVDDTDTDNLNKWKIKQENTEFMDPPIKQEIVNPDPECSGQMSNQVPIKIERHLIEINDIKEETPNIDDIVMENLNQTGLEYEDEDDDDDVDVDASWEPWDKRSERDVAMTDSETELDEDEWKPVSRSKTRNQKAPKSKRRKEPKSSRIKSPKEFKSPRIKKEENEKIIGEKHEHQCFLCEASYTYHPALVRHVNTYHNNKFHCSECKLNFISSSLLRKHMQAVHSQLFLICPVCKEVSTSLEDINTHIGQAHSQSAHLCPNAFCQKIYTSEQYLKTHLRACRGVKQGGILKCDTCDKVFTKKYTMEKHLEVHMGVNYKCDQCDRTFSHERSLYRHKDLEHSGKVYKCDPCNRIFADDRGLAKHKKIVHKEKGGMPEKYQCTLCPNKYWQKITLLRHIKNEHYSCDICKEKDPSNSKQKKCQHNQLKCPRRYRYKRKYKKLTFTCDVCNVALSSKKAVKYHLQSIHYGGATYYTCPLCKQRLKHPDSIRKHKKDHLLHQFECSHCIKVFADRKGLIKHLNKVAGGVPSEFARVETVSSTIDTKPKYSCSHCFLCFTKKTELRRHVQGCSSLHNGQVQASSNSSMKFIPDYSSPSSCQVKTEEMEDIKCW